MSDLQTIVIKIVLMGDGAVGKTMLKNRYLGHSFETMYAETIGADFTIRYSKIKIEDRVFDIKWQIWDIAGQIRYSRVRTVLFDGTDAGLLLFDISNRESYISCYEWMSTYVEHAGSGAGSVCLVGNKVDLREEKEMTIVSSEEGQELSQRLSDDFKRPIQYIETSAKTGYNVDEAFASLAKTFLKSTMQ